jgi:hypothetical protein
MSLFGGDTRKIPSTSTAHWREILGSLRTTQTSTMERYIERERERDREKEDKHTKKHRGGTEKCIQ